jgi:hypothetical protein
LDWQCLATGTRPRQEYAPIPLALFMEPKAGIRPEGIAEAEGITSGFADVQFHTAEVLALWPSPSSGELPSRQAGTDTMPKRRGPSGIDYQTADRPLLEEMRAMITAGTARNATDAARVVGTKAQGHGKAASKVARLAGRYLKTYPTAPAGP